MVFFDLIHPSLWRTRLCHVSHIILNPNGAFLNLWDAILRPVRLFISRNSSLIRVCGTRINLPAYPCMEKNMVTAKTVKLQKSFLKLPWWAKMKMKTRTEKKLNSENKLKDQEYILAFCFLGASITNIKTYITSIITPVSFWVTFIYGRRQWWSMNQWSNHLSKNKTFHEIHKLVNNVLWYKIITAKHISKLISLEALKWAFLLYRVVIPMFFTYKWFFTSSFVRPSTCITSFICLGVVTA